MLIYASYLANAVARLIGGRSHDCNHSSETVCILFERQSVAPSPETLLLESETVYSIDYLRRK